MSAERPVLLSVFPGIDLLGRAFEAEWPEACLVRGPDLIFGGDVLGFHIPPGIFSGILGGPPCQEFSPLVRMLRATGREPRHPNRIPEFERLIREGGPDWFLMENVPPAPVPAVDGYATHSFLLCPTWLGEAQRRVRRFTFGVRGPGPAPDLRHGIDYAALELPECAATVTQSHIDNSPEAKGRVQHETLTTGGQPAARLKRPTVTSKAEPVPIKIGGNGQVKRSVVVSHLAPGQRTKTATVLAGHGPVGRGDGYCTRLSIEEMCELQGLPADFLRDAPFTMDGKRQVIGNGVHMVVGRALAHAVRAALARPPGGA